MTSPDYVRHEHHEFIDASEQALENGTLQSILGRLGDTLGARNREAWQAFDQSDQVRERARAIKDATLADLDQHLETLEASVLSRGGHVHWAADGETACRAVLEVLQTHEARMVVKSKSMTSEEIHLNKALEQAGVEVVETDFGEYIIQVAGHRPSHIVGPALHMSSQDVTEVLNRVSEEPLSNDRVELAAFARRQLRSRFAAADVGITGVNFAVAETGSIVLISNEGNARLTTSLPRVHIAIMGIEKVIPRLADLPCFLKVLARAATGQKLSIYTSIVQGKRAPDELDGAEEFHLIILDNGRSQILQSPLRESLFCIRCGACLNACPVYRNVGGHAYGGVYAGPIGAVLTPLYGGLKDHHHLPHASSLCGACQAACPVKIQIPDMLVKLREQLHTSHIATGRMESLAYRGWALMLRHPRIYRWATWFISRTLGRVKRRSGWLRRLPGQLGGWTKRRDFPAPAPQRFRDWWKEQGL